MSDMEKEDFEQQWRNAFDGAELSPDNDFWDKIEPKLASASQARGVGKHGYFFSLGLLVFLGGFLLHKTNTVKVQASTRFVETKKQSILKISQVNPKADLKLIEKIQPTLPPKSTLAEQYALASHAPLEVREIQQTNSPDSTVGVGGTVKKDEHNLKRVTQDFRHKIDTILQKIKQETEENAIEALVPLASRFPALKELKATELNIVVYPEALPATIQLRNFWVGVQRGVTLSPTKLDIHYEHYLEDYAKAHQLSETINLRDFFTEINETAHYSIANQGDIRFGYHFSPRWQFIAGLQYRAEFLEQSTNAFFVNYYDYSRHSFLLDILEGNINNPNFVQAILNHPTYRPNNDNNFTMSQFNQQSSIHVSSRFEYVGIPMQVGYTLRPFKKLGFTVLGAAQVDKLMRSTTSSYELKDDVATTYKLNSAIKLSTWSWQIGGGIQAEYKYNTSWALTANSMVFQNIKSIKENKYVEVRPRGLQINMGAKYMF